MEAKDWPYEGAAPEVEDDEEEAAEIDETGRFSRYSREVGTGRFKHVYKGFDEKQGIDIAWSRILQGDNGLSDEQMTAIVGELAKGLELEHANIIRCYRAWHDERARCINFITEFFTSGNLRDYRQRHKHLELNAVKKWARQILLGLDYLHNKDPAIVHGDLRCDKIYINGHSGEIKIGDLGLATLQERRFAPGVLPNGSGNGNQYTRSVDVFAFGLCVLELATTKKLDHSGQREWEKVVETVQDADAKSFIQRCLAPLPNRPAAKDLLDDRFFLKKVEKAPSQKKIEPPSAVETAAGSPLVMQPPTSSTRTSFSSDDAPGGTCEVGTVRGEDYNFQFSGKVKEGKLHFRLKMEYIGDEPPTGAADDNHSRTIDFVYDPEVDTPDDIAVEIGNEFALSSTDRDICAAALKEWLAKGLDQDEDEEHPAPPGTEAAG